MRRIIKFIFPDYCLGCKIETENYGLCANCFKEIKHLSHNACLKCGLEFEVEDNLEKICASCIMSEPIYDRHLSCVEFKSIIRKIISDYKYHDQHINQDYLVSLLLQKVRYFDKFDIICSVPMHWKKLFFRNFNQSSYLAKAIAKAESIQFSPLLIKTRNTLPQIMLSAKARNDNLRGAIKLNQKFNIKDKVILLIDDVYTTGSTLNECSKALKQSGAAKVYCLTVARKQQL